MASEAHAITLAVEGLLGVVFTVATLTDQAVDVGEVFLSFHFRFSSIFKLFIRHLLFSMAMILI